MNMLSIAVSSGLVLSRVLNVGSLHSSGHVSFMNNVHNLKRLDGHMSDNRVGMTLTLCPISVGRLVSVTSANGVVPPGAA